jgi:hypothetical protein
MEEEKFEFRNSKLSSVKGVVKTFFSIAKQDWNELDHKLVRITFGAIGLVAFALFWLYFLRAIIPF